MLLPLKGSFFLRRKFRFVRITLYCTVLSRGVLYVAFRGTSFAILAEGGVYFSRGYGKAKNNSVNREVPL